MLKTSSIDSICMGCFSEMKEGNAFCTECGYNASAALESIAPHLLRPRTILNGKYLLGKVLGEGGFGITYIGWDLTLDLKVAVKEFYPNGFVSRETTSATTVIPLSGKQGEFFLKGREKFVDEAKTLAKFRNLPGIVAVNEFFIENNTAYIVMEYIEGETLKGYLASRGGTMPSDRLFEMMKPVMVSLNEVHKKGLIHRDISPDNIMITRDGYVKLLDFGAAREFADSGNKSLSIMLKPGYAPEEQYRSKGKQGPWTDVYALCATLYKVLTGVTPDESANRVHEDEVLPPSALGVAIKPQQEAALMKGMAVLQNDRHQNIQELCDALYATKASIDPVPVAPKPATPVPVPEPVAPVAVAPVPQPAPVAPAPKPKPTNAASPSKPKPKPKSKKNAKKPPKALFAVAGIAVVVIVIIAIALGGGNSSIPISAEVGDIIKFGRYDWLVLDVKDESALIISNEILESRAYDEEYKGVTWEICTLRAYLNGDFYNSFNKNDKKKIIKTTNTNPNNPEYDTDGGYDTEDYIFLLSADEANKYSARIAKFGGGWWLRSPGIYASCAVCVLSGGDVTTRGDRVDYTGYDVRPAMWVELG